MNRLTRDQVLIQALDLADSPALDAHDRPSGTIVAGAFSIQFLQDALDMFHNQFPLAATIQTAQVTIPTTGTFSAPSDCIVDVRHGLVLNQTNVTTARRLFRTSYQKLLSYRTQSQATGTPRRYTVLGPNVQVWPTPDQSYGATLSYYALPAVLASGTVPNFPSDQILVDFVRLRALEYMRSEGIKPGTALAYARQEIGKIRAAGLFNDSEDTNIPLDPEQFVNSQGSPWAWMGPFS